MLKQKIQKFIELEEKNKELNKKQKLIREEKKKIETEIVNYIIKNNMDKTKINLGSSSITLVENYTSGNLSMSLVYDTLCNILNTEKAQTICDKIQDVRDESSKSSLGLKIKSRS
jgi:hypothetical protein